MIEEISNFGEFVRIFHETVIFNWCLRNTTNPERMLITPGKLLAQINSPDDLKKLDPVQLVQLSEELRQFIIDNVSVYGGHFGASLGVVELTVA